MDRSRLKHRLFGLNPKKVNAHLRQLNHLQDKEWGELEETFRTVQAEHDRLQREREHLLSLLRKREQDSEYLILAASRTEAAVEAMNRQTQQELADLQREVERMQEEHQRKLEMIHQQTEHYSQVLQDLLNEFGLTMQKFNAASFELPQHHVPAPAAPRAEAPLPKNDKVVQFRVKSPTERQLIAEALQRTGTLAGGEEEVRADHLAVTETASAVLAPEEDLSGGEQETSAFWGNIQSFVNAGPAIPLPDAPPMTPETEPVPAQVPAAAANEEPPHIGSQGVKFPPIPASYEESPPEESGKESGALSAEIMSIRNRYIVGKLAGEDLHDADGRLIVAKSGLITAEIVDLADKAGRLPDLIVNMKIPGMGDEQTS